MPESTTFSQSSTPTPYNVGGNGAVTFSEGRWNQEDSTVWQEIPPTHRIASVPVATSSTSNEFSALVSNSNNVKILNNQVVYSPSNLINIPYQGYTGPNAYSTSNPGGGVGLQIINEPNQDRMQTGQVNGGHAWPNQSSLGTFMVPSPGWMGSRSTGVKKQKRIRTAFTTNQMMALEQEYVRTRYLDRARRLELAEILRLNERVIKIWFQNRRMKEKKDRMESQEDIAVNSTSESSSQIGHAQIPMLIPEQCPYMNTNVYGHSEAYGQGNFYGGNFPVISAPAQMPAPGLPPSMLATGLPSSTPATSLPITMPATTSPPSMPVASHSSSMPGQAVQNMYNNFMTQEEYQQLDFQMQPYNSSYNEVHEVSPQEENPAPSAPRDTTENDYDLSFIRSSFPYSD